MESTEEYRRVLEEYQSVLEKVTSESRLCSMRREEKALYEATRGDIPFDPRYNAVNWAEDCLGLANEIAYSFCWMEAHAATDAVAPDANLFGLCYHADNCIMRIDSFRDKAALLAWAYYCPFNPERKEEVLRFEEIVARLRCPIRFGLSISNQRGFLKELERLEAACFKQVEQYRHLKIHRLEPKIVMRERRGSDRSYLFLLSTEKEIKNLEKRLNKDYSDPRAQALMKRQCLIARVYFDSRPSKNEFWFYKDVRDFTRQCTYACIDTARALSALLRRRAPLRGK